MLKFAAPAQAALGPVSLHEVLEHSLRLAQRQMQTQGLTLHRSFQAAPDLVEGNEFELQQALVNLLLNAVEATPPGGSITVGTERVLNDSAPARLRVVIRDTGTGIAPENLGRLFQTFFTTKPNGTGLGLAVTQRIIRGHRGSISAESEPGKGTSFSILLPAL
jgi:two-component system sensor histidine kinase HydH